MQKETTIEVLNREIEVLKSRILPEDTGHLHTAIGVLKERVRELEGELQDQR